MTSIEKRIGLADSNSDGTISTAEWNKLKGFVPQEEHYKYRKNIGTQELLGKLIHDVSPSSGLDLNITQNELDRINNKGLFGDVDRNENNIHQGYQNHNIFGGPKELSPLQLGASMAGGALLANVMGSEKSQRAGDILQLALPTAAVLQEFKNGNPKEAQRHILHFAENVATTFLVKYATRNTNFSPRPNGSDAPGFWSGHTTAALTGALQIDGGLPVQALAAAGAGLTGVSRVLSENHTTTQVIWAIAYTYLRHKYGKSDFFGLYKNDRGDDFFGLKINF